MNEYSETDSEYANYWRDWVGLFCVSFLFVFSIRHGTRPETPPLLTRPNPTANEQALNTGSLLLAHEQTLGSNMNPCILCPNVGGRQGRTSVPILQRQHYSSAVVFI